MNCDGSISSVFILHRNKNKCDSATALKWNPRCPGVNRSDIYKKYSIYDCPTKCSQCTSQPALHMRPTRVPNGFLYGAFVGALYGPLSVFANGFLMGPIWFINKGHIWAPYGAFIVK